jgi:hypothetical protein
VEVLTPPGEWEIQKHESRELRQESLKFFLGLMKQKETRIGINVRQSIHEKSRDELNVKRFLKKAEEEFNNEQ